MRRREGFSIGAAVALTAGGILGMFEYQNGGNTIGCENESVIGKIACGINGPDITTTTPETSRITIPNNQPQVSSAENSTAPQSPASIPRKGDYPDNEILIDTTTFGRPFAWPIGRPHKGLYYTGHEFTLPCADPFTCHHDGTPAVDIAYADPSDPTAQLHSDATETIGEKVRAITNGVVNNVAPMKSVPGCFSVQFKSDPWPDGRPGEYYWYGHLINPVVVPNQHLAAGEQIASVGPQSCNPGATDDSYPHLHIDQGVVINGVPQRAGGHTTDSFDNFCEHECRNPNLVRVLNTLFEEMPA